MSPTTEQTCTKLLKMQKSNLSDSVGNQHYVFNIHDNKFRLVVVKFIMGYVFVRWVVGVSPSRVNDFVSGRVEPSLRIAANICKVLGISPSVMMGL